MTFLNKLNSAHIGKMFAHWHLVIAVTILHYCFRKLTLIQYDCMIQMFCLSLKASKFTCLTAANLLNYIGVKHSFVMNIQRKNH